MAQLLKRKSAWFTTLVLLYLALFAYRSLTHTHHFTPDSMNYTIVARNVLAGRGITRPELSLGNSRLLTDAPIPAPFTTQGVVYPLLIALVGLAGIEPTDAALLIPVAVLGLILWFGYRLAQALYDADVALLALIGLLAYWPLRTAAGSALSEAPALVFLMATMYCLVRACHTPDGSGVWALVAGLAAGLAFATRQPLGPLVMLGAFYLAVESAGWQRKLRNGLLFLAGSGGVIAPLLIWALSAGTGIASASNPSYLSSLSANLIGSTRAVAGNYLGLRWPELQAVALLLLVGGLAIASQQKIAPLLWSVLFSKGRYLLAFWSVGYLAMLLYLRTTRYFDPITTRLTLPAGVTLVLLLAAYVGATTRVKARSLWGIGLALLFFLAGREAWLIAYTPPFDEAAVIADSESMQWVASQTTERDLIIGNQTIRYLFYFDRQEAITIRPYPSMDYADYDTLSRVVGRRCGAYEHIYLMMVGVSTDENFWQQLYGLFLTDLMFGRIEQYPGIEIRQRLEDGVVFELNCQAKTKMIAGRVSLM